MTVIGIALLTTVGANPAAASGRFDDDDGSVHEGFIEAVAAEEVTLGCGPRRYCPRDEVSRDQMASFLARALQLPETDQDFFPDDRDSVHEDNINRIAQAGITSGDASGRFNPFDTITRGQLASFLARSFDLEETDQDFFADDDRSVHEGNINRVAQAGITAGDTEGNFNPSANVNRAQMATFLARALGLDPIVPELSNPEITQFLGYDVESSVDIGTWYTDSATINGVASPRAVVNSSRSRSGPANIDFVIGRDYERLSTAVGFLDDVRDVGEVVRVDVFGDGVPLYSAELVYGRRMPIDLDVANVLRLRLQVTQVDAGESSRSAAVAFAEPTVTGDGPSSVVPPATDGTALGFGNQQSDADVGTWFSDTGSVDGVVYQQAVINSSRSSRGPATIDFTLDRTRSRLLATVGFEDFARDVEETVIIEVFDETNRRLESFELTYGRSVPLNVDVTGVLRLRLSVTEIDRGTSSRTAPVAFANLRVE